MVLVIDILSWVFLLAGGIFCVIGTIGLLRMPDVFTRLHGASVVDTLGMGFIILGLILQAGFTLDPRHELRTIAGTATGFGCDQTHTPHLVATQLLLTDTKCLNGTGHRSAR